MDVSIQFVVYLLFLAVGMYLGWMFSPYLDKVSEWRNKRIKKEVKKEVEQCLA